MSKKKLFDEDSDEDIHLKTENEYAKKYDTWREKEELHKLEQKYGDNPQASDASSDSDTESEELEVSEETETQFLKTLALLKTKDPRIYDPQFKCFEDKESKDEVEKPKPKTLTFEDSDDDDDDGPIFTVEKKAQVDEQPATKEKAESTGKKSKPKAVQYLTGETEEEVDKDLAPLRALWSDPKLNEGEAFLRDYILNKRYLDGGSVGGGEDRLRDDEDLEEDERRVEEQGQFERAYNFRFEEPDHEFLKRFPRTVSSTRPKDDRRSKQRAELRERKARDKQRKMDEIARLKALKLKEIQDKIAKIKEVTGNEDLAFNDEDIEGDFDPEEHDRRMRAIFDAQYYQQADGEKPVFPDLDEELEIENWDEYDPETDRQDTQQTDAGPHCEDDDFNMDADYDPKQQRANLLEEIQKTLGKKRRNRKKKSKLAQLLSSEKPKFMPMGNKTYDEYMEEYYKMDCEDIIGGDLPTRFKYREVVPNDYGLSIEEILLADDKELTQWVPLKRIVRHRPPAVERGEVATYAQRARDQALKRKVLPSLFKPLPEEPELAVPVDEAPKKKKKKNKNKDKDIKEESEPVNIEEKNHEELVRTEEETTENIMENSDTHKKKKKKKNKDIKEESEPVDIEEINHEELVRSEVETTGNMVENSDVDKKKKKRKNKDNIDNVQDIPLESSSDNNENRHNELVLEKNHIDANNKPKTKKEKQNTEDIDISSKQNKTVVEISKKELNKNKKHYSNVTSNLASASNNTELHSKQNNPIANVNVEKPKMNNKKPKKEAFTVEKIQNEGPSHSAFTKETKVNSLKRKSNTNTQQVAKKFKLFDHKGKGIKNKFKNKVGKSKNTDNDNPLSKISDERLKAYGLNPKKYRSFLKYKKF